MIIGNTDVQISHCKPFKFGWRRFLERISNSQPKFDCFEKLKLLIKTWKTEEIKTWKTEESFADNHVMNISKHFNNWANYPFLFLSL